MPTLLAEPNYIERNPETIVNDIVGLYETSTGKKLYPAQPERIMTDVLAYREVLKRVAFQEAAKQNLVQYASGAILEHLGRFFAVERLPARKATTTLRFTADNDARPAAILIPANTQVRSRDTKVAFVTLADVVLELTDTSKDVEAEALIAGSAANDYAPGEITEPLTTIAFLESVTNVTLTERGANVENDEALRNRVIAAPESFSVAGSKRAYQFWALSAHPAIIDVAVESRVPGTVQVYPLTQGGTPSQQVLDDVAAVLSDETVRPLCDTVQVFAPVVKNFTIAARVTLLQTVPAIETRLAILEKLNEYTAILRQRLGRDIVPAQIIARIQQVAGVYNVQLDQPASVVRVIEREFGNCTNITLTLENPVAEEAL
jgi:phage-related baseplate assembly protein